MQCVTVTDELCPASRRFCVYKHKQGVLSAQRFLQERDWRQGTLIEDSKIYDFSFEEDVRCIKNGFSASKP